jgi:cystathionine beta-lyase
MPHPDDLSHILTHLGENRAEYFHAIAPPIIQTSNFAFPDLTAFRAAFTSELDHHIYSRGNNPTVQILRRKLAALEGTDDCLVFGSGSAAVAAAVISQVRVGEHIVCVESPYSWTKHLLPEFLPRFGVTTTFVDGKDAEAIAAAIQPNTRVLYLESPSSLTFAIQDLRACAQLAKEHGLTTIIDNSHCSPIFQRPAEFGIDIVVHSGTKYLNGHSDAVLGVVCGSQQHIDKIFASEYMCLGGIIGPQEAALCIRGLRTLDLRVRRSDVSAQRVATYLEGHPKVERVLHPLLPSFPQYALAREQMSGSGGLFSVYFKAADKEKMAAFLDRIERFLLAVSWGGHESLMIPLLGFYDIPGREDTPLPWNLVRFYVGLEDPEWLIADLEQALAEL